MIDLDELETAAANAQTKDEYLAARQKVSFIAERLKTIKEKLEVSGLAIIETSGPIVSGDMEYDIDTGGDWKPVKKPVEFAQGLMEELGGDWDSFSMCLASDCFKHGQTKKELARVKSDKFKEFFKWVEKKKIEGKPARIKETNVAFLR